MEDNRHFIVSGRVQGVFFRASTQDMARSLGLRGWVRNCDDGRVEGVVRGDAAALEKFRDWLGQGPAQARVDHVVFTRSRSDIHAEDFEIR